MSTPAAAYCPHCDTPEMMVDLERRELYCMNCKYSEPLEYEEWVEDETG